MIDTNVILDVLLKRQPFYEQAADVLKLSVDENVLLFVSASAITDIYYVANRMIHDKTVIKESIKRLLDVVNVASVSENEIKLALGLDWGDFEDAVQYSVALLGNMDEVVTRNPADYKRTEIPITTPEQILARLRNG